MKNLSEISENTYKLNKICNTATEKELKELLVSFTKKYENIDPMFKKSMFRGRFLYF